MRYVAPLENYLHFLQQVLGFRTYTLVVVGAAFGFVVIACGLLWLLFPKYASFVLKNLFRNKLQTILAGLAIMYFDLEAALVSAILVPIRAFVADQSTCFTVGVT